jgi:8-amino-3,8-dideoxy-alpha-D-manno-octulosonate transaminase
MIVAQKKNKAALKDAVSKLPGVTFRTNLDQEGDSATFLAFFLPDAAQVVRVNQELNKHGAGAIYFARNTWHYYPKWEHLISGSSLCGSGWPFKAEDGRRRVVYDPEALPKSAGIMDRLLVYQVPIHLTDDRLELISTALKNAALAV